MIFFFFFLFKVKKDPLLVDLVLDLPEDGFLLRFDPSRQQLKCIEVYDVPKIKLSYSGTIFSCNDKSPTLVNIYERFGPTHPGELNSIDNTNENNSNTYYLHYPGLTFGFPIPTVYVNLFSTNNSTIPPMEFPDRTTPVASRIIIYNGNDANSPILPNYISKSDYQFYFEEIVIQIGFGIHFITRNNNLNFNSTTQDVISLLGPPSRIFNKEEDKMKIHTNTYTGVPCTDYFYNYFNLGIDILFDSQSHLVKKFILHTNYPSHYEFNQYAKCNFKIIMPNTTTTITGDSKWNDVQSLIGDNVKPVVHNRGSNSNPFGATLFYGFNNLGLIFEIMKNQHIASIQLYNNNNNSCNINT